MHINILQVAIMKTFFILLPLAGAVLGALIGGWAPRSYNRRKKRNKISNVRPQVNYQEGAQNYELIQAQA